jgi:LemA protein
MVAGAALAGVVVAVGIVVTRIYNNLVTMDNRCGNAFSQIEIQLKRRYDLIPNLVECTRSYLTHERETLENVIAARNQASQGLAKAAKDPQNAEALKAWVRAEGALAGAMGGLSFVMEQYPDLKANESVAALTEELTSTENRISFARQFYNDVATSFNTYRRTFPTVIVAGKLGHDEDRLLLEFDEAEPIAAVPQVALT